MKKALTAIAALLVSVAAYGQGQVAFNTRVLGEVEAPVFRASGAPAGAGYTAQLFLVSGTSLTPLTPATVFRTDVANRMQYVDPVDVTVTGVAPGGTATLRFRAWNSGAASFDTATEFGQSNDITIPLGGGTLPPTNLVGLQGFTMVPEPSTIALGILGVAALLFRRRKA